ncbi:ankyrin repeat domain-containing protein [Paenibacillus sp. NEAU-GSW1]|uniref:ankyrin repeat domain-containing protein n=1 Tax=Paenibacillus sp. NEAU-GSW1 TaxID=2682486 RepID=UPI0015666C68|nr:ankyrin repeat domain-containing protein [Paenibacillus sp. NEAU-GSW1]
MSLLYLIAFMLYFAGISILAIGGDAAGWGPLAGAIALTWLIVFFRKEARKTKAFIQWIEQNKEAIFMETAEYEGVPVKPDTKLSYYELVVSLGVTANMRSRMVIGDTLQNGTIKAIYTAITAVFGWWGIPWGPVLTLAALRHNLKGGNSTTPHEIVFYYGEGRPKLKKAPKLVKAAYHNDLNKVYDLLQRGEDPHATDHEGRTALLRAAENGNVEMLELLIDNGADWRHRDNYGCTALIRASVNGRTAMVNKLLSLGANPNEGDNHGSLPLIYSGSRGFINVMKPLLDAGADPNLMTDNRTTALMKAAECEEVSAVRLLLEAGADPTIVHSDEITTAYTIALENNNQALIELLESYMDRKEVFA